MPDRPDMDEPFSLYPMEGEDVLREMLGDEDGDAVVDDAVEDDES